MASRTFGLSRPFLLKLKIRKGILPGTWYGFCLLQILTGLPASHIFQIWAVNCWLTSISPLSNLRLTWVGSYLSSRNGPEPIGLRLVSDEILSGEILPKTALGTMVTLAMKFFTKIGLYGLDFSLNSTVLGSVALTELRYCHTVAKVTGAVLPSSKVKTTSSAVRSDPSDHLVPSCSGRTNVLSSGCCNSLARPGESEPSSRLKRTRVS